MRPAIEPLFRFGGGTWPGGGWLTSHDVCIKFDSPPKNGVFFTPLKIKMEVHYFWWKSLKYTIHLQEV